MDLSVLSFHRAFWTPSGSSTPEDTPVLNPAFVEALMGLPIGWTGSEDLGTPSFQKWLREHGAI